MADHYRSFDAQATKRGDEQIGLTFRCPDPFSSRSLAKAVSRSVESDHAMSRREPVKHAAATKIFGARPVSVEQHDRCSDTSLEVVQADAVHLYETARRGIVGFRTPRTVFNERRDG
jgi:hypothetical protein